MRDTDLYGQILGVQSPSTVTDVSLRLADGEVEVMVEWLASASLNCPDCGSDAKRYDTRRCKWQHLPTCQCRTILVAEVPRVRCPLHGVKTVRVPWSDPGSGFKFHVAMHLGRAVDRNRRSENRKLRAEGDTTLTGTKHLWLFHPDRLDGEASKALKTSRAWMLKELAMEMWQAHSRGEAKEIFDAWYSWAIRSRLDRESFRAAIYFHLGGLDLYPDAVTHTDS